MEDPRVFSDRNCECVVSGTDSPDTLHSVFADRLRSPLCYPVQQHDERRGNGEDQETEGVTLGNIRESERLSGFPSSGTSVQDTHHEKCGRTNSIVAALTATGLVLAAIYSLRMVNRIFLAPSRTSPSHAKDFSAGQMTILGALMILLVVLGVHPQPIMTLSMPSPLSAPPLSDRGGDTQ